MSVDPFSSQLRPGSEGLPANSGDLSPDAGGGDLPAQDDSRSGPQDSSDKYNLKATDSFESGLKQFKSQFQLFRQQGFSDPELKILQDHLRASIKSAGDKVDLKRLHRSLSHTSYREFFEKSGVSPWELMGDVLSELERGDLSKWSYQRGMSLAHRKGDGALVKLLNEKANRVLGSGGYQLGFDEKSNPIAQSLYVGLLKAGVSEFELNQSDRNGVRVIEAEEIFNYVSAHLASKPVQSVLSIVGLKLSSEELSQIGELGFAKVLADRFRAKATELAKQDLEGYGEEISELLELAHYFEPKDLNRLLELAQHEGKIGEGLKSLASYGDALRLSAQLISDLEKELSKTPEAKKTKLKLFELQKRNLHLQTKILLLSHEEMSKALASGRELAKSGKVELAQARFHEVLQFENVLLSLVKEADPSYLKHKDLSWDIQQSIGASHGELGKLQKPISPRASKQAYQKALKSYELIIASHQSRVEVIALYQASAEIYLALGDNAGAVQQWQLASNCTKLRSHLNKGESLTQDIKGLKQDRIQASNLELQDGHGNYIYQSGNYIPSEAHELKGFSGVEEIPYWARVPELKSSEVKWKGELKEAQKELKELRKSHPVSQQAIIQNLQGQISLREGLAALSEVLEAGNNPGIATRHQNQIKQLSQQLQTSQQELLLETATAKVGQLSQTGKLHDEALFLSPAKLRNKGLTNYVSIRKKGKPSEVEFKEEYLSLKSEDKIKVLAKVIQSAERFEVVQALRKAKGVTQHYHEGRLAFLDGDKNKAIGKLRQFRMLGKQDPKLKAEAQHALELIQQLNQGSVDHQEVVDGMLVMLGQVVSELDQDQEGKLKLSDLKEFKNTKELTKYLSTQSFVDGINFNQVVFASYQRLINDKKFKPLFAILNKQLNPNSKVPKLSQIELSELLYEFKRGFIHVSLDNFAEKNLGSEAGIKRLEAILKDPRHYSSGLRANLLEAIIEAGANKGIVPKHLRNLFEKELSTWSLDSSADLGEMLYAPLGEAVTNAQILEKMRLGMGSDQLSRATKYGLRVLQNAREELKKDRELKFYQEHAQEVQVLEHPSLKEKVTPEKIREMAKLQEVLSKRNDAPSQMRAKIIRLRLAVLDNRSFESSTNLVTRAQRVYIDQQLAQYEEYFSYSKTPEDFARTNELFHYFINGQATPESTNAWNNFKRGMQVAWGVSLGDNVHDVFQSIRPTHRSHYDELRSYADEYHAAQELGEKIQLKAQEFNIPDPKLKAEVEQLSLALGRTGRKFLYGYKQKCWLSRGVSWLRESKVDSGKFTIGGKRLNHQGEGERFEVRAAYRRAHDLLEGLSTVQTQAQLEQIKHALRQELKEGGILHQGFVSAEVHGVDELMQLAQTILESYALGAAGKLLKVAQASSATNSLRKGIQLTQQASRYGVSVKYAIQAEQYGINLGKAAQQVSKLRTTLGKELAEESLQKVTVSNYIKAEARGQSLKKYLVQQEAISGTSHYKLLQRALHAEEGVSRGVQMSLAGKVSIKLSNGLEIEPVTLLNTIQEASATALGMGASGFISGAGAKTRRKHYDKMWQRIGSELGHGAIELVKDIGVEVFEELGDAVALKFLQGDFTNLSYRDFRAIVMTCIAGGGMKAKELIKQGRENVQLKEQGKQVGDLLGEDIQEETIGEEASQDVTAIKSDGTQAASQDESANASGDYRTASHSGFSLSKLGFGYQSILQELEHLKTEESSNHEFDNKLQRLITETHRELKIILKTAQNPEQARGELEHALASYVVARNWLLDEYMVQNANALVEELTEVELKLRNELKDIVPSQETPAGIVLYGVEIYSRVERGQDLLKSLKRAKSFEKIERRIIVEARVVTEEIRDLIKGSMDQHQSVPVEAHTEAAYLIKDGEEAFELWIKNNSESFPSPLAGEGAQRAEEGLDNNGNPLSRKGRGSKIAKVVGALVAGATVLVGESIAGWNDAAAATLQQVKQLPAAQSLQTYFQPISEALINYGTPVLAVMVNVAAISMLGAIWSVASKRTDNFKDGLRDAGEFFSQSLKNIALGFMGGQQDSDSEEGQSLREELQEALGDTAPTSNPDSQPRIKPSASRLFRLMDPPKATISVSPSSSFPNASPVQDRGGPAQVYASLPPMLLGGMEVFSLTSSTVSLMAFGAAMVLSFGSEFFINVCLGIRALFARMFWLVNNAMFNLSATLKSVEKRFSKNNVNLTEKEQQACLNILRHSHDAVLQNRAKLALKRWLGGLDLPTRIATIRAWLLTMKNPTDTGKTLLHPSPLESFYQMALVDLFKSAIQSMKTEALPAEVEKPLVNLWSVTLMQFRSHIFQTLMEGR